MHRHMIVTCAFFQQYLSKKWTGSRSQQVMGVSASGPGPGPEALVDGHSGMAFMGKPPASKVLLDNTVPLTAAIETTDWRSFPSFPTRVPVLLGLLTSPERLVGMLKQLYIECFESYCPYSPKVLVGQRGLGGKGVNCAVSSSSSEMGDLASPTPDSSGVIFFLSFKQFVLSLDIL
ncbi:hypothetical protein EI555_006731 [Monodon monoceros]|uniref:Uncharacterized protein n=1 Tax=Monodon monoceros TaxID=40151 RepID=A0A4U1F750_MONMO|nr:hypothetical protein EI555_006731 [Monodon monoceros]